MKTFRIPVGMTVVAIVAAVAIGGPKVGLIVALLAVLEISISFDNAIVNAAVLKGMTAKWQQIFLTWGILIAVFGMRLVFPIVIVAAAAGLAISDVVDQALNKPALYAHNLKDAAGWKRQAATDFTASSASATLTFTITSTSNADHTVLIDSVKVAAINIATIDTTG